MGVTTGGVVVGTVTVGVVIVGVGVDVGVGVGVGVLVVGLEGNVGTLTGGWVSVG